MEEMPFELLVERSVEELQIKTAAHDGTWHLGEADWAVDQTEGTIVFTTPQGLTATCPVQIIGTYNPSDSSWLWGWDHPSVQEPLQEHARQLREYGEQHGIAQLTIQQLECTEEEAWEFTALACKLCDAQGGYRGPAGQVYVFMTFGTVQLKKADQGGA